MNISRTYALKRNWVILSVVEQEVKQLGLLHRLWAMGTAVLAGESEGKSIAELAKVPKQKHRSSRKWQKPLPADGEFREKRVEKVRGSLVRLPEERETGEAY